MHAVVSALVAYVGMAVPLAYDFAGKLDAKLDGVIIT